MIPSITQHPNIMNGVPCFPGVSLQQVKAVLRQACDEVVKPAH